ncbi:MAG: hypothetical protein N0E44_21640 [Candidatus Thiodiazotropha lotti]|nr:hypothetical protein [Candidatus Thiodiazotropha lotti]MCW4222477.1 hypothetical protein [Candidatus Thiodiazotropha lotti]
MDVDFAHKKFNSIKNEFASLHLEATEADTRFQIIDRIFKEVLGWDNCDFRLELHTTSGYADYVLTDNGVNKFVVEAKRASHPLVDTKKPCVSYYTAGGSTLKSAIDGLQQAQSYCLQTGVTFSLLTNGFQWIGFWAIREHGIPPFDGKAVVFPSLSSVAEDFSIFYDLFSKEGIRGQLFKTHINEAEGFKITSSDQLESVTSPDSIKLLKRSTLASDIEVIFTKFFSDISGKDNAEMLAECFVESKESHEAEVGLEKIARNIINDIGVVDSTDGYELQEQIRSSVERSSGDFVLIIGNKGAGKSTFIDRFFRLVISGELKSKCLVVRIDLADSDGDESSVNKWLSSRLAERLENEMFGTNAPSYNELQGVFWDEYDKWRRGEFATLYDTNKTEFKIKFGEFLHNLRTEDQYTYVLKLLSRAVRANKQLPCIIFDNTDHYPKTFQEKVFQHAQSINRAVLSFIICPITDTTVWQLSKSGPFQSYHYHSFYLPVPQSKDILQKRVAYLRRKVDEEGKKDKKDYTLNKGLRLQVEDIKGFVACIEEVFVNTEYVSRTISWLSNHDIRRGLLIAERIITSPIISMESIIKTWINGEHLVIPEMRIRQALLYGNYTMFRQDHSEYILNLFSISPRNVTSPLIKPSIIRLLLDVKNSAGSGEEEYLSVARICDYFDSCGLGLSTLSEHISDLLNYRLIEPYDPTDSEIYSEQRLRVTHSGQLHYEFMNHGFIYLQNMSLVTPIRNIMLVDELRQLMDNKKMSRLDWDRLKKKFVSYLLEEDCKFISIPKLEHYSGQRLLREELRSNWVENV